MKKILITTILLSLISCEKDQNKNAEKPLALSAVSSNSTPSPSSSSEQPAQSSKEILGSTALKFVNSYLEQIKNPKETIKPLDWIDASNLVSVNFKKSLKKIIADVNKTDPEMGLDFDPVLDAQDYPDDGFVVESVDSSKNQIVLVGQDMPSLRLTVQLIQQDQKWLVDGCGTINLVPTRVPK